ncbi:TetR/AcrR family transcriptional regulator [Actinoplanes sp. L3-i22]|uniref:TetR/AcrR family transcriptional regulator n=1 Tax=Actinoplanes sp. L3-i22 TaxID=2836373 RepID=UPI001C795E44|nr:TetR/AcrR family transcriptional regulator [Actinoplanes sp. L3-i22]BCY10894.1 TetR family transcriptional regulator [Actinoplanes sp. L3-i22]
MGESRDRGYHHGDLPAALVEASFGLLAEVGLRRFSVAAVARRLGVSSAAPYRHFPDRDHLLSAVSAAAARDLRSAILTAADAAGPDPSSRLASLAGAYFRYVVRTGAGLHVIYAAELYEVPDEARRAHTRALMETLLDLAFATEVGTYQQAVALVEAIIAVAHGYTTLFAEGFFNRGALTIDTTATRAITAAQALIRADHPH